VFKYVSVCTRIKNADWLTNRMMIIRNDITSVQEVGIVCLEFFDHSLLHHSVFLTREQKYFIVLQIAHFVNITLS